jgi:hypothetical protein
MVCHSAMKKHSDAISFAGMRKNILNSIFIYHSGHPQRGA